MGRGRRAIAIAVGGLILATSVGVDATGVEASPDRAAQVRESLDSLDRADTEVRSAETEVAAAREREAGARIDEDNARAAADRVAVQLEQERALTRALAVAGYKGAGAADDRDRRTLTMVLGARTEAVSRTASELAARRRVQQRASEARQRATEMVERAEVRRDALEATRLEQERAADVVLSSAGAGDLPAIAYLAYRATAAEINQADPRCNLPAAALAAIGRVRWMHGWQSTTETALVLADTATDAPRDPRDIQRAITPIAARLCASGASLARAVPLATAVRTAEPDPTKADIMLAVARRYSRTPGLDLGDVPADVTEVATTPQFDDGGSLPRGDITAMLAWAWSRLGTPYSQCLGADVRPQDPVCPEGTSRFGRGFFDCSGFVSAAYRKIGIYVPTTTMAMESDERLMATTVGSTFDPAIVRPGDVFLMDGHTGIYVGDGFIVHARSLGLTLERIPPWVANATFAILRPTS